MAASNFVDRDEHMAALDTSGDDEVALQSYGFSDTDNDDGYDLSMLDYDAEAGPATYGTENGPKRRRIR